MCGEYGIPEKGIAGGGRNLTEAEQMAVYNLQVLGVKAEVAQHFATIVLIVIACVALVVAIVAMCHYVMKCKAEIVTLKGTPQPEAVDTSYTTLNLGDGTEDVVAVQENEVEEPVQKSDDTAE